MATNGSLLLRSLGLVVQAPPSHEEVRPTERVCSILITVPPGAKRQPAALVPQRSLRLAVHGSPPSHEKVRPTERVSSVLITAPPGAKWQPAALVPRRSLGLVVQAPLHPVTRKLSHGAGLQRPYHSAYGREMATNGSSAAKESGACSSGSPQSRGSSSH
ncbi:hypothetical protein NDU88_004421 [Pleurodeles waltl]|uniref:Uncharacterized protein n=1 Tax=Pleurodeles waltl TaxID=8319 RepID=A0AAV7L0Y2_PLEWA|nr:hypothetical protein NDU88_004421 [Pleurodeles waltl]